MTRPHTDLLHRARPARAAGEATPYDLKQVVNAWVGNFWSLQHSQLYAEPARLARAGYLDEERERGGRRRRRYRLTAAGREALDEWRGDVHPEPTELRDLGLLKLFLGADPAALAGGQIGRAPREARAVRDPARRAAAPTCPTGDGRSRSMPGIGHEREWVRFWERLAKDGSVPSPASLGAGRRRWRLRGPPTRRRPPRSPAGRRPSTACPEAHPRRARGRRRRGSAPGRR